MIILAYFVKLLKATMTYGTIRLWESANNQITELGPLFTIIALFVDLGSFPRRIKNMVSLIVLQWYVTSLLLYVDFSLDATFGDL